MATRPNTVPYIMREASREEIAESLGMTLQAVKWAELQALKKLRAWKRSQRIQDWRRTVIACRSIRDSHVANIPCNDIDSADE